MALQRGKVNGRVVMYWLPEPPITAQDLEKYGPPVTLREIALVSHARKREQKLARKR